MLWGPEALMNTPANEWRVDVDGDGTVFFTTYLRPAPNFYDTVRVARTVLGAGGFQTIDTLIDDQSAFGLGLEWPRVAYTGNGAVIAWLRQYDELGVHDRRQHVLTEGGPVDEAIGAQHAVAQAVVRGVHRAHG